MTTAHVATANRLYALTVAMDRAGITGRLRRRAALYSAVKRTYSLVKGS